MSKKRHYWKKKSRVYSCILGSEKGGYLLSHLVGSTIGVSELNFSVRNGKRWNLAAITT